MKHRYYSLHRPVSIGTYPKAGLIDFTNYDSRIEKCGKMVWAELIYDRQLTDDELYEYEFIADTSAGELMAIEQAKDCGLYLYYDRTNGHYIIPVNDSLIPDANINGKDNDYVIGYCKMLERRASLTPQWALNFLVFELLKYGKVFCEDGSIDVDRKLAMEMFSDGKQQYMWIRDVEIYN